MSESPPQAADLKAQYSAQLTTDLERNAREQDRLSAELAALQAHLEALRQDRELLAGMRQALGTEEAPAAQAADTPRAKTAPTETATAVPGGSAAVPAPRRGSSGRRTRPRKQEPAPSRKPAPTPAVKASKPPTLGELIREHLLRQSEPRSAAEVTGALAQAHPERAAKAKVVRMALEGLVAKGRIQRTRQNKSVFYSAVEAEPSVTAEADEAATADPS
ncbi:hypothetical protein [Streptomyces sp. NPDC005423]|uniref:hypothetical protein n=1 Tax=Streptomyces sp. NPDC005423 TaxID=3155343 RepID=UPI0033BAFA12